MSRPTPIIQKLAPRPIGTAQGSNRISNYLAIREAFVNPPNSPAPPAVTPNIAVENIADMQVVSGSLAPGATINIPHTGISFYFAGFNSLGPASSIDCRPNTKGQTRSFIGYVQGTGQRMGAAKFTSLDLQNNNPATVSFALVIGGGTPNGYDEFIDKRVVIAGGTGTVPVQIVSGQTNINTLVQVAPTTLVSFTTRVGAWANSLAANTTQSVSGTFTAKGRKQIIFSNNDASLTLQVLDSTGNIVGTIQPSTAFTFETSDTVQLKNPSLTTAVNCNIGEIYYT